MSLEERLDRIENQMKSDFEIIMKGFSEQREILARQEQGFASYKDHAAEMFRELRQAVVSLDERVSRLERKVG